MMRACILKMLRSSLLSAGLGLAASAASGWASTAGELSDAIGNTAFAINDLDLVHAAHGGDGEPCTGEWQLGHASPGPGVSNLVGDLTTWDPDGAGPQPPQLIAGGSFTTAGGVTANFIARWDGSAWQPIGTGMNNTVLALTTWDPDGAGPQAAQLVAGGGFATAGGVPSRFVAFWGCPGVACLRGDSNGDAAVDFADIDCFVSALVSEAAWLSCAAGLDAAAYICSNDCNCDGAVDIEDIDCFVQCLVVGGCPACP